MINQRVLMSGVDYFSVEELNPYSDASDQPDIAKAKLEHAAVKQALETAGVEVITVNAPTNCQDGVYTANWALVTGQTAVLANLPDARKGEEPFARKALAQLGLKLIAAPYRFSGQGDALACGKYLFCGSGYRTDIRMHDFLASQLDYEIISLETIPARGASGAPLVNKITGLPDSYFYDLDLALAVLRDDLIAYCPEAFLPASQERLAQLPIGKIVVSLDEAIGGFACNLVSTGKTVVMSSLAPELKSAIEAKGLNTIALDAPELLKGGGFIRCTTLTIN